MVHIVVVRVLSSISLSLSHYVSLQLLPQSPSESEVKEDDNETEHLSATSAAVEQAKKKKKKRKKKGGGKYVGSSSHRRSSEDNADVSDMSVSRSTFSVRNTKLEERDSDDNFLETFSVTPSPKLQAVSTAKLKVLLNIQHKNLNAVNEMRRMFGSKVIQTEKGSGRLVKNKRTRNARNVAAVPNSRTTWLVTPKDTWQPVSRIGISMNLAHQHHGDLQVLSPTGGPSGTTVSGGGPPQGSTDVIYFNFEHNKAYRALQERFLAAVESNDTENIVRILDSQPYHIDSLIQLGELCKMSEEMATAADLIEHVIYALESAFHPMFSLTAGNCRLDYRRQENRAIFVSLFKHAQYLEGRACPRTALEIAKLIMTFDPIGDPLAMILAIDYYAIRSRQFEWLIELYREWETSHNLAQLPNMAYSYAMAEFYEERNRGGEAAETPKADAALQYALLMFPGALKPLLEEVGVQIDSRVNGHNYFGVNALKTQPVALQQLVALYVCRSKLVWRDAELLPWLERNTNAVLDRVDAGEDVVAEYAAKRTQRYKNPPREILRHIVLSDYKEKVPLMPFVLKETEPIVMYDPLPPHDSINIYTRPKGPAAARTFFNRNASSLSMFFQSLLPSFSVPAAGAAAEGENNVGEAEGAVGGLPVVAGTAEAAAAVAAAEGAEGEENANTNSIRSSLDTMNEFLRYFLSNTRPTPEQRNDADVDESDEVTEDEDEEDNNST